MDLQHSRTGGAGLFEMLAYGVSQGMRVGWFMSHYLAAARLAPRTRWRDAPDPKALPGSRAILKDLADLLRRDWDNIRAGRYKAPFDLAVNPARALRASAQFFADLPSVHLRRRMQETQEIFRDRGERPEKPGLPR